MVLTRPIVEGTGRTRTMRLIHEALSDSFDVELLRLYSILETRRPFDYIFAAGVWLWSLITARPMALQCVLFASRSSCKSVVAAVKAGGFDSVYVDMERSQYFLRLLNRDLPTLHVTLDLDDLLSRRAWYQAQSGLGLTLGFVANYLPTPLGVLLGSVLPSGLVLKYESNCLQRAEIEMVGRVGSAVLVSPVERDLIRAKVSSKTAHRILAISPPASVVREFSYGVGVSRFVFVGSDAYQPNLVAIQRLLRLWRESRIGFELHVYGKQLRSQVCLPGVHWHGFVADLAEAYEPGSVALAPLPIPGGIKTKVVEAWAYGCPVLGTLEALEGLIGPEYPLCFPLERWPALLQHPEGAGESWVRAVHMGQATIRERLSPAAFRSQWQNVVSLSGSTR